MNTLSQVQPIRTVPGRPRTIHVIQGDMAVTAEPESVLSTVLGSCIATCMRDPVIGIGGMNHFLLPGTSNTNGGESQKYGVYAMECLINGLLRQGAMRDRLEAKIFGGASVVKVSTNIGEQNIAFVKQFLRDENIQLISESTGGTRARRIKYWPVSGEAKQLLLDRAEKVDKPAPPPPPPKDTGDIELF